MSSRPQAFTTLPGRSARSRTALAGVVLTGMVLAGCGGGEAGPVRVYATDFSEPTQTVWLTQRPESASNCTPLPVQTDTAGDGFMRSEGPWWVDPNHAAPGLGYLYLVAFAYHADWSLDGAIVPSLPGWPLDLRESVLNVRWRAPDLVLPPGARLLFWIQAEDPDRPASDPRFVNYAMTSQPLIPKPGSFRWQETQLRLSPKPGTFECLGTSEARAETYGCAADLSRTLATWRVNLGFIILFEDRTIAESISGAVDFDRISLVVQPQSFAVTETARPLEPQRGGSCRPKPPTVEG
jgi:hypothetical protein